MKVLDLREHNKGSLLAWGSPGLLGRSLPGRAAQRERGREEAGEAAARMGRGRLRGKRDPAAKVRCL